MKKTLSWQELKTKSASMVGWKVYWIRPMDRKKLLHGLIRTSEWFNPFAMFRVEPADATLWKETWMLRLTLSGDAPCNDISIDPGICPETPYELQNGDIQIPYGQGTFHFTPDERLNEEVAFAA